MKKLFLTIGLMLVLVGNGMAQSISMLAEDWKLSFSPGMPKHPSPNGEGWEFDFPLSSIAFNHKSVNYVNTKIIGGPLVLSQMLVMTIEMEYSPDVVFEYGYGERNPCVFPAHVRFYIQQPFLMNRWWSNPISLDLRTSGSIAVPLLPKFWSNVNGHYGDAATIFTNKFNKAVKKASDIGMTFGGGCFFGHGVWISRGSAKFILREYKVIE